GVEQRQVGGVSDHALMQQEIVREPAAGADPHQLARRALGRPERVVPGHGAGLDRSIARGPLERGGGKRVAHLGPALLEARQRLRIGCVRHHGLVLRTLLLGLEGCGQVEDGLAVLDGDHAPRGEGPAVADAVHHVEDGRRRVSGAEEVGVQGVHHSAIDGAARGDQRLTRHLPTEGALPIPLPAATAEDVHLELLEVEDLDEAIDGVWHAPLWHGRTTVAPGWPLASKRSPRKKFGTCAPPSCEGPSSSSTQCPSRSPPRARCWSGRSPAASAAPTCTRSPTRAKWWKQRARRATRPSPWIPRATS